MAEQHSTGLHKQGYKFILMNERVSLVDHLDVSHGLYDHLIQHNIADTRVIEQIKKEGKTDADQAGLLLDYLEKRPDADLKNFVEALKNTNQAHIAKWFESDSVKTSVVITDMHKRAEKPSTDSKLQPSETVTTPHSSSDAELEEARKNTEKTLLKLIQKTCDECMGNMSQFFEYEPKIATLFGHLNSLRVEYCCILLHIECPNIAVLDYLWLLCETGGLTKIFQGYFVTDQLLDKMDLSGMKLEVKMLLTDYMAHRNYLRIEETHHCKQSADSSEVSGPSKLKRATYPSEINRPEVAAFTAPREGITLAEGSKEPNRKRQCDPSPIYQVKRRYDMELDMIDESLREHYKDDSATRSTESDITGSMLSHTGIGDSGIAADRHGPLNLSSDQTRNYLDILKEQRVNLVDHLELSDGLSDYLIKYDIADTRAINRIKKEGKTRELQAIALLDFLETRPDKDFDNFVEALEKTNQGHLAKLFKRDSSKVNVRITDTFNQEQRASTDSRLQPSDTITTPGSSGDARLAESQKEIEYFLLNKICKLIAEVQINPSKTDESKAEMDKLFQHLKILRQKAF